MLPSDLARENTYLPLHTFGLPALHRANRYKSEYLGTIPFDSFTISPKKMSATRQ